MHTDIACDDVVAHSEYLVVVVFPPSAHTAEWCLPEYPKQGFPGEYLHTHICMYGEIHRYALHVHHDMHAFPGTHALVGGAEVLHTGSTYPLTPSTYSYGALLVMQRTMSFFLLVHTLRSTRGMTD